MGIAVDPRARRDHLLNIRELQRAVLHLEPGEIVVLCPLAVAGGIGLRLGKAEDLLAIKKLLLGGVIQSGLRRTALRYQRQGQGEQ